MCPSRIRQRLRQVWNAENPWSELLQLGLDQLAWVVRRWRRPAGRTLAAEVRLADKLVDLYRRLDDPQRQALRELLGEALRRPGSQACRSALAFAGRVPLPQARQSMLKLLADGRLTDESAGPPAQGRDNPSADLIRALGKLSDRSLAGLFRQLLHKHLPAADWDDRLAAVVHQAAWALCKCCPPALLDSVPRRLGTDPLFLSDLLAEGDAGIASAVAELLGTMPPARRRLIVEHLPELDHLPQDRPGRRRLLPEAHRFGQQ